MSLCLLVAGVINFLSLPACSGNEPLAHQKDDVCVYQAIAVGDEWDFELDGMIENLEIEITLSLWDKLWIGYEVTKWKMRQMRSDITSHFENNKQTYANLIALLFFALSGKQREVEKIEDARAFQR